MSGDSDQRIELLRRVWLFAELTDAEIARIAAVARIQICRPRELLIRQGDSLGDLFAVVAGYLKVSSVAGGGQEVLLSVMGPGDVFGEIALLDAEPRSASVTAVEICRLLVVPRMAFRLLLEQFPALAMRLLQVMARRVRLLSERTEDNASLDVRARLAKTLLDLAKRFGAPGLNGKIRIRLRLSQQDLGQMVAATREMVNKCLRGWAAHGIVRYTKGVLMIAQDRLQAIVEKGDGDGDADERQHNGHIRIDSLPPREPRQRRSLKAVLAARSSSA